MIVALAALSLAGGCAREPAAVGGSVGAMSGSGRGGSVGGGGGASLAAGAAASAGLQSLVNQQMSDQDRKRMAEVLEFNRAGSATSWVDTKSNEGYTIIPHEAFNSSQGTCRNFEAQTNIAGNVQRSQGTACRKFDGSWEVVK
jgi:surface antigen